jgi:AraC-like DNA-binding protein
MDRTMENRIFNQADLAVLLDPGRWRLVAAQVADEQPLKAGRHRRWRQTHQHAHPYAEAMIALAGTTVYGTDHGLYPCRPGTVFVFEPGRAHDAGYPPRTAALRHLWIAFFQDKAMARLLAIRTARRLEEKSLHCLIELQDASLWRPGAAAFAPDLPPPLARLRLVAALANILAALVEEGYRPTGSEMRLGIQKEKIAAICRHLWETGGAGASLAHLVQSAGYGKFHFLRLFRRQTGRTVHDFINQARQRKVKALLNRGLALKEISAELGFSCPAAFSRWYRPFRP